MNINLSQISDITALIFWLIGVVMGTLIVNSLAKERVDHVVRSTIFGFLLSLTSTLVLIQIYKLLNKQPAHETETSL